MAASNVIKKVEIQSGNNLTLTKLLGAEAQNIDVGFDANGDIIEDITVTTPTSTEGLSTVLKNTQEIVDDAVTWSEENILGAKNLIPIGESVAAADGNGIAYSVAADGAITLTGTATAQSTYSVELPAALDGEYKFTIDCANLSTAGVGVSAILRESDGTTNIVWFGPSGETDGSKEITVSANSDVKFFAIVVNSGATVSGLVIKPMLRLASIKDRTYVPYAMTNKELTDAIQGGGTGGGHTIVDPSGTEMDQRSNLQFKGAVRVEDDSTNDATKVVVEATVNRFTVLVSDWVANTEVATRDRYPYKAIITTNLYGANMMPTWQMNGVDTLPSNTEANNIELVQDAIFTDTNIILYALDKPEVTLVLEVVGTMPGGFANMADDVTYDNTSSGLIANTVQEAIDEITGVIRGTLIAGETTVTFINDRIRTTSLIDPCCWGEPSVTTDLVFPTHINVTNGQCILTYEPRLVNAAVGIRVY